ncbi:MAG: OmpA family protein [Dermatophilaceae bacterium]
MNDSSAVLQRLSAALDSGDRDAVMACFAADATVHVVSGGKRTSFAGSAIRTAVDPLLAGFDGIKLTPSTRQVTASQVVEESVISGSHTGSFAGEPATSNRVHVNVKLSATPTPDGNLKTLLVEADTRALFAQIAGNSDGIGAANGMLATVRERHQGVRIIDSAKTPAPAGGADVAATRSGSRRRWAAVAVAAALLLTVALIWRPGSASPAPVAAAGQPASSETSSPTPAPSQPAVAKTTGPTPPAALPVIATAAPKTVPHVQAGKQLVLKSDVLFAYDSSTLSPAATAAVTTLAGQIRSARVTGTIQINGYTDNRGGVAYCLALSRARALAVARVLQAGLAGQRVTLTPQGFGQANPVATNTTNAGQALNRRVTIVLPKVG